MSYSLRGLYRVVVWGFFKDTRTLDYGSYLPGFQEKLDLNSAVLLKQTMCNPKP